MPGKGEDHDLIDIDPHQRGGFAILGHRSHCGAHARALDNQTERQHEKKRETDHQDIEVRNGVAEGMERGPLPFGIGIGSDGGAEHAAEGLLQEERYPERADQWRQPARAPERPVGNAFGQQCKACRSQDRDRDDRCHGHHWPLLEKPRAVERRGDEITGKSPAHDNLAMGKVDHPQHAVDHRVAERDLGVDAADGQAEHHEIEPLRAGVARFDQGSDRTDDDDHHDPDAQAPERDADRVETGSGREPRQAGGNQQTHFGQIFFGFLPIAKVLGSAEVYSKTDGWNSPHSP